MDFASWSPSHLLVVAITLLAFGAQLIIILTHLKTTANQHSQDIKQLSEQMQRLRDEIRHEIRDVRGEIHDVRLELSKLNQNHIDHLTHHERS